MNTDRMLDRYVRGGGNRATGAALLAEILDAHDGANLDAALAYWGFTR
jgi:hypothetical protein